MEEGLFVIEGPTLIAEAISAGWEIEEIFTNDKGIAFPGTDAEVFALARGVLERLSASGRIRVRDAEGQERAMTEDERQSRIREAAQVVAETCQSPTQTLNATSR